MRVVFDTNVVISGMFFGGLPSPIMAAWDRGGFACVVSMPVLNEYRRVGAELAVRRGARSGELMNDEVNGFVGRLAAVCGVRRTSSCASRSARSRRAWYKKEGIHKDFERRHHR